LTQDAAVPVTFEPARPNLSALSWNPTYDEARAILMVDLYGHRYDGVQMSSIDVPSTWPRSATITFFVVPAIFAVGAIPLFFRGGAIPTDYADALVILAGILALIGLIAFASIRFTSRISMEGYRRVKLERLATDNGLVYQQRVEPPAYPGCIFTTDTADAYLFEDFSTSNPRVVDFGNFHPASTGADGPGALISPLAKSTWGFMAIKLNRDLPNLLLISKTRVHGDVKLPVKPDPRQRLSLEGDFDKYFTLYCPAERQEDALFVITPDLMALLIDKATPFDVEIVDQWMFFYSRIPFDLLDQTVARRVFDILKTIGSGVVHQTAHYTDAEAVVEAPASPTISLGRQSGFFNRAAGQIVLAIVAVVVVAAAVVIVLQLSAR
jgi:hypothetical protein